MQIISEAPKHHQRSSVSETDEGPPFMSRTYLDISDSPTKILSLIQSYFELTFLFITSW